MRKEFPLELRVPNALTASVLKKNGRRGQTLFPHLHPSVLLPPPIVRLLRDLVRPTCVADLQPALLHLGKDPDDLLYTVLLLYLCSTGLPQN